MSKERVSSLCVSGLSLREFRNSLPKYSFLFHSHSYLLFFIETLIMSITRITTGSIVIYFSPLVQMELHRETHITNQWSYFFYVSIQLGSAMMKQMQNMNPGGTQGCRVTSSGLRPLLGAVLVITRLWRQKRHRSKAKIAVNSIWNIIFLTGKQWRWLCTHRLYWAVHKWAN